MGKATQGRRNDKSMCGRGGALHVTGLWACATHLRERALQPACWGRRLLRLLPLRELAHVGNGNLRGGRGQEA